MALGEPMQGLAGQELLRDLALELDAVGAVLGHGLSSFESPAEGQFLLAQLSAPRGPLQSASKIDPMLERRATHLDVIGSTKIKKGFHKKDKVDYAEAEVEAGMIVYYCPTYTEEVEWL